MSARTTSSSSACTADEVAQARAEGHNPRAIIEGSRELSQALSAIGSGVFSPDDRNRYSGLIDGIYTHDWFMVAADFDAYAQAQREVDQLWTDPVLLELEDDLQHGADGLVLVRPHDPAICQRNLESWMKKRRKPTLKSDFPGKFRQTK